jgi:pimeloyl-ACP methyl ester carboxylesterase
MLPEDARLCRLYNLRHEKYSFGVDGHGFDVHVLTLVICGDHDESNPRLSQTMHEKIAGSKLVIVPQSGQLAFVDQPNLYMAKVTEFLQGKL